MNEKQNLDLAAYQAAWAFVGEVERGNMSCELCRKIAAKFLEAYADCYDDENARYRAQKLRETITQ